MTDEYIAIKENSKWSIINIVTKDKKEFYQDVSLCFNKIIAVKSNDLWRFIDLFNPNITNKFAYSSFNISDTKSKIIEVQKDEKWGIISQTFDTVLECTYDYVRTMHDGLIGIGIDDYYGLANDKGKVLIDCIYDDILIFNDGLAKVEEDGYAGYINITDEVVIDCKYDNGYSFNDGFAYVEIDDKGGYINTKGVVTVPIIYDELESEYDKKNNFLSAKKNGKFGFIDFRSGNPITPFKYNFTLLFEHGLGQVQIGGKWGFVNEQGKEITQIIYYNEGFIGEYLTVVAKEDTNGFIKYGFINKSGEEAIPFIYDNASSFKDGLTYVTLGKISGYIDEVGNQYWDNELAFISKPTHEQLLQNQLERLTTEFRLSGLNERQKAAFVCLLFGLAQFDTPESDLNEKEQYVIDFYLSFWGISYQQIAGYIEKEGIENVISVLSELSEKKKILMVVTSHAVICSDGKPNDKELRAIEIMFSQMGISNARYNQIIKVIKEDIPYLNVEPSLF